jgi:hypothetical protein
MSYESNLAAMPAIYSIIARQAYNWRRTDIVEPDCLCSEVDRSFLFLLENFVFP